MNITFSTLCFFKG